MSIGIKFLNFFILIKELLSKIWGNLKKSILPSTKYPLKKNGSLLISLIIIQIKKNMVCMVKDFIFEKILQTKNKNPYL